MTEDVMIHFTFLMQILGGILLRFQHALYLVNYLYLCPSSLMLPNCVFNCASTVPLFLANVQLSNVEMHCGPSKITSSPDRIDVVEEAHDVSS